MLFLYLLHYLKTFKGEKFKCVVFLKNYNHLLKRVQNEKIIYRENPKFEIEVKFFRRIKVKPIITITLIVIFIVLFESTVYVQQIEKQTFNAVDAASIRSRTITPFQLLLSINN